MESTNTVSFRKTMPHTIPLQRRHTSHCFRLVPNRGNRMNSASANRSEQHFCGQKFPMPAKQYHSLPPMQPAMPEILSAIRRPAGNGKIHGETVRKPHCCNAPASRCQKILPTQKQAGNTPPIHFRHRTTLHNREISAAPAMLPVTAAAKYVCPAPAIRQ